MLVPVYQQQGGNFSLIAAISPIGVLSHFIENDNEATRPIPPMPDVLTDDDKEPFQTGNHPKITGIIYRRCFDGTWVYVRREINSFFRIQEPKFQKEICFNSVRPEAYPRAYIACEIAKDTAVGVLVLEISR